MDEIPWGHLIEGFVEQLSEESDRGCVLVAHAFIDERIQELLAQFFLCRPQDLKRLVRKAVGGSQAFTNFPSRVGMLQSYWRLTDDLARALKSLNALRNTFAHHSHSNRL